MKSFFFILDKSKLKPWDAMINLRVTPGIEFVGMAINYTPRFKGELSVNVFLENTTQ